MAADPAEIEKASQHEIVGSLVNADLDSTTTSRLGGLVIRPESVLREHQVDALQEVIEYYRDGGEIGYVDLPTGVGKTVLFVEICLQLARTEKEEGKSGKSIVLVPTTDLVTQTVGSVNPITGKKKGFKGFAPELDVRPIHGKIKNKERIEGLQADVLVTTYDSFRNIIEILERIDGKDPATLREMATEYDEQFEEYSSNRDKLISERQERFYPLYLVQSIAIFRSKLVRMQALLAGETAESDDEYDWDVNSDDDHLATADAHQNELKRKRLEPFRENIEMLLELARSDLEPEEIVRQLLRHTRKLAPKIKKRKYQKIEINGLEVEAELSEAELPTYQSLDPFSALMVTFNRKLGYNKRLTKADFMSYKLSRQWSESDEKIETLRNRATYARSMAHKHRYEATVLEAMQGYELLVCDEAHRAAGEKTWDSIKRYALSHKISILGLTATDKFVDRTLEDYFGEKIHSLSRLEAMEIGLISPLALFVHNTDLIFEDIELDASGDYDPSTLDSVVHNARRNQDAAIYASMLTAAGIGGLVSTNAGSRGEHARIIEELFNRTTTTDPKTGEQRKMRVQHILGYMDTDERADYYAQFESGELDWLVFVDVLREGWDSDRAKALINLRSTRSPLLATQRLGRIGRVDDTNPVSVVIDFYDDFHRSGSSLSVPPVLATDVFQINDVEQGHVIGIVPEDLPTIIGDLSSRMPGMLKAYHIEFMKQFESAILIDSSGRSFEGGNRDRWLTAKAIDDMYRGYMPPKLLEEARMDDATIRTRMGRNRSGRVMELYNESDVARLHQDKPILNPWMLVLDDDGTKWAAPEACIRLLEKLRVSIEDIKNAIEQVDGTGLDYRVGRVQFTYGESGDEHLGLVQLYKVTDIVEQVVPILRAGSRDN